MKKNVAIGVLALLLIVSIYSNMQQSHKWEELNNTVAMQAESIVLQAQTIKNLRNPQHFESFEEMQQWVRNWTLTKLPIVIGESNSQWQVTLRASDLHSDYWGCDDIAEAMQRDALKDGYVLSKALVDYEGKVYGVKVSTLANHAGNLASTEKAYWFIEPQLGTITKIIDRE